MTDDRNLDRNDDGRHDFRAGTATADSDQIVDNEGHAFAHGRVSAEDEADEQ